MSIVPRFSLRRIDLFNDLLKAKIEWEEKPESHIFRVNLRGLKNQEPRVTVEGKQLIITVERQTRVLRKSFQLPDDAITKQVTTRFEEGLGVLTITISKGLKLS
ncbi:16.9 kDa class I heat shock protein 3-like [Impatiens glandulifera]|uniref:16.9 kDa class I heat shock protein 3-like n=1 Tax=Impatiens glandulifera TaxID=253017 RepID=UPI001FB12874|nr:16.9 kDa class I heat shock protein 3-like [Impatiens glandulifera]